MTRIMIDIRASFVFGDHLELYDVLKKNIGREEKYRKILLETCFIARMSIVRAIFVLIHF